MTGIRRALLFSSGDRYLTILVNFLLIAAVSRLLTPQEIGIAVIGTTIITFVEGVRDSPSSYLVQKKDITEDDARTAFTVMFLLTALMAGGLFAFSGALATLLRQDGVAHFLQLIAACLLPGCIERPISALLRRELAFATCAFINVTASLVAAIVTITLALLGFSYFSFGWGLLAGGSAAAVLAVLLRPNLRIFKPFLGHAREVLPYNAYGACCTVLATTYNMLPYMVLGRLSQFNSIGFYDRTVMISRLPEKLNAGVFTLAVPAFARVVHQDSAGLSNAYLRAFEYLTGVEWPIRVLLALLAHPVVLIILGPQWTSIIPLVQLMSLAFMFATPQILTLPLLIAVGALRQTLLVSLIPAVFAAVVISVGAWHGLETMVWAMCLVVPVQTFVAIHYIRKHAPFAWSELGTAAGKSAIVTLCSMAGPILVLAASGFSVEVSFPRFLAIGLASGIGWVAGVWLVRHPIWFELQAAAGLASSLVDARLKPRWRALMGAR